MADGELPIEHTESSSHSVEEAEAKKKRSADVEIDLGTFDEESITDVPWSGESDPFESLSEDF